MKVSVSRAKVTGIVAALACLAFSAIGLQGQRPAGLHLRGRNS